MWSTSDRRQRLPSNWKSLRLVVLRRDSWRCQLQLPGCLEGASEVDHRVRGDNHALDNLQAVCSACHKKKTLAEAASARRRKRELRPDRGKVRSRRLRPVERHPGLV